MLTSVENRLPYLKPEDMNEAQKKFYDYNVEKFGDMPYICFLENGELNGPSNAFIHDLEIAELLLPANRAICGQSRVPKTIQEIVILVTVTSAKAAYGTYAHCKLAEKVGVEPKKIRTITAGQKPDNLTEEEAAAYDFAYSLCQAGPCSGPVFDTAMECFGKDGVSIIVFLVGMFKLIGTMLNAYNECVPEYRK